jgi:hypothetical protein
MNKKQLPRLISKGTTMTDESLDNDTLWKLYSPQPNPWFSSKITYKGWGTATFEKPVGTIEGPTKIVVNETGELIAEMECKKLDTKVTVYGITDNIRYIKFAQGNIGSKESENQVAWGTGNSNPCSKLTIQTHGGSFKSNGKIFYMEGLGFDNKLRFSISEGMYEASTSKKPKYWAVPLTNFVSTFHLNPHPLLAQHPLRLFTTPLVPNIEDEKQRNIALVAANRANMLIDFYFGEKVGYIQPVLEYNKKAEKLKSGKIQRCITALMISEVTSGLENVWFPYDYTNLLSFALGIHVGASWVEFRDDNGDLVSRKHITQFENEYKKGYAVINEPIHGGVGDLISMASNSPEFGKSYFRVLIGHLIRLQSYSRQIEDHMDLLCRTFETLCEEFGLSVQNLITYLPDNYQAEVKAILGDTSKKIEKLPHTVDKAARLDLLPVLQQIARKVENARNIERAFGLAVLELLKKYDLPDSLIMEKYYAKSLERQDKSWAQTLTKYRGAAVHTGYFAQEKHDIWDVLQMEDHLQDILVRIALKILNYKGKYRPRIKRHLSDGKEVNWVTDETTATELGYGEEI